MDSCQIEDATLYRPYVIAHRGASGALPELTLAAFHRAIEDGADFVEWYVERKHIGMLRGAK